MLAWLWRAKWYLIIAAFIVGAMVVRHVRGSVHEVQVADAIEGPLHRRIAASGLVEAEPVVEVLSFLGLGLPGDQREPQLP